MSYRSKSGLETWEILPGVLITSLMMGCWRCGKPTVYYDLDFGTSLCYPDCMAAQWIEYCNAGGWDEEAGSVLGDASNENDSYGSLA